MPHSESQLLVQVLISGAKPSVAPHHGKRAQTAHTDMHATTQD